MSKARFIICEKSNQWAIAFRRCLRSTAVRVYETRSLDQCYAQLVAAPKSLIGVEVTPEQVERQIRWLWKTRRVFPDAWAIVLGYRGLEPADWMLREAGALYVLHSRRNIDPTARLVQRIVDPDEAGPTGTRRKVWAQLPWSSAAEP